MAKEQPMQKNKSEDSKENNSRYSVEPEFWDSLLDALPPWFDEIGAIVLLVFGVISFMALFGVSADAPLPKAWADVLTSLFGYGSLIISAGIFLLGIIILLPKVGIFVHFSNHRILALEIAFLSILAILHLSTGDGELRAIARAGEGGGYVGWGIVKPIIWIAGPTVTLILYTSCLVASLGVVIGINRTQINAWLQKNSERLQQFGTTAIKNEATSNSDLAQVISISGTSHLDKPMRHSPANSVVRIRPDLSSLPPSQRAAVTTPSPPQSESVAVDEVTERLERVLTQSEDPSPVAESSLTQDFNIIGELLPAKNRGPQLVQRPDGRIKRYFSVENLKEQKKIGRRLKSLPPLDLLQDLEINPPDEEEINHNVVLIENTLLEFDINIDVVDVRVGPTVTQYAVQPFREVTNEAGDIVKERTRLSKIAALSGDLALALSAKRLRLETPVPGQSYMGVEVPNKNPNTVALRSVYESKAFYDAAHKSNSPLVIPLGRDVSGEPVIVDIATMPHLLIAGTTGSGKSVCIAAIATALALHNPPDKVKMVMLDPKMVELSRFNGLPHLLGPVETDLERIVGVLRWCTREMERRYKLLEEHSSRNIEIFNSKLGKRRKSEHLPYIVVMIDEIGDLMMSRPEETEKTLTRLAQMARAIGLHLIVATQRPSVDVITGLIKANFPVRMSFAVASGIDSRVILDTGGADTLLGQGDMLYLAQDASGPKRLQGCFISDEEVRSIVGHWKQWAEDQAKSGTYEPKVGPWERGLTRREFLSETDPMLEEAIELVVSEQEASASMIQRRLGLGYPRAARIIDLLEELGVIGEQVAGGRSRQVLIAKGEDPFKEIMERRKRSPK